MKLKNIKLTIFQNSLIIILFYYCLLNALLMYCLPHCSFQQFISFFDQCVRSFPHLTLLACRVVQLVQYFESTVWYKSSDEQFFADNKSLKLGLEIRKFLSLTLLGISLSETLPKILSNIFLGKFFQ